MSAMIGPGKGKNFCNVLGPAVLTMDEVDEAGMQLTARVNGDIWVTGSLGERSFSFAEVLAWASFGEDVVPGEFIATGTIGGGCGIELDRWLQPGDVLELEAAGIGVLRNPIGPKESARPGVGLPTYAEIPPPYRAPQFQ
jgi:2-keto-4-pentenoate hydratase/2-oxohepta-3-ene-1,7-dioic acid hydratase in catechol pathway